LLGVFLSALAWFGIGYAYYHILIVYFGWYYQDYAFYQFLSGVCAAFAILIGPLVVFSQTRQINLRQGVLLLLCLIAGGLSHLYMWQFLMFGIPGILGEDAWPGLSPLLANYYFIYILLFAPLMACIALLCTPRETYSSDDWGGTEAHASAGLGFERHIEAAALRNYFGRFPAWLIVFLISGVLGGILFLLMKPKNPDVFFQIVFFVLPSLLVGMILLLWTNLRIKYVIIGAVISLIGCLVAIGVIVLIVQTFKPTQSPTLEFLFGVLFNLGLLVGPLAVIKEARVLNARQISWGTACLLVGGFCILVAISFTGPGKEPSSLMKFVLGGLIYAPLLTSLTLFSTPSPKRDFGISQYDY
jgi:hypothetical protein